MSNVILIVINIIFFPSNVVFTIRDFNALQDYNLILDFYHKIDNCYYPKLSDREGGIEGHVMNIVNNKGMFVLYEVDNSLEGVVGFYPMDKDEKVVQFTFFAFSESFRNSLAPYRMAMYLIKNRGNWGYADTEKLVARTWYKESSMRLEKLGFQKVGEVKGDVVSDRTSYYYEGNLANIIDNIVNRRATVRPSHTQKH